MAHPCQRPKPGLQLLFLESHSAPLAKKDPLEEVVFGEGAALCAQARGASSAPGKGHEEGGLAYAKAGSSLRSLPGNSRGGQAGQ